MGANTRGCLVPCRQDVIKMKWNMDSVEPLADTIPALFISVFKRIVVHHIVIDIFCQCFIISGTSLTTSHNIIQHKGVMCDNFLHLESISHRHNPTARTKYSFLFSRGCWCRRIVALSNGPGECIQGLGQGPQLDPLRGAEV